MMSRRSVGIYPGNPECVVLTPGAERRAHRLALAEWFGALACRSGWRADDYRGLKEKLSRFACRPCQKGEAACRSLSERYPGGL